MTLQMSKSLIEGGGVSIHIYTHYNGMHGTVACLLSFDSLVTLFY